jgi:hypothetical protein
MLLMVRRDCIALKLLLLLLLLVFVEKKAFIKKLLGPEQCSRIMAR